jgi:hydrogenase maturation protein HypF
MSVLPMVAQRLIIAGQVQGVGFRPFVYRQAMEHGLTGWVRNDLGRVSIHLQGDPKAIDACVDALLHRPPAIARPRLWSRDDAPLRQLHDFQILASEEGAGDRDIHVPPDYFTCDACLAELRNPADRRYRYPFINCTQCGPRYTLIDRLPYDRPNTSMAGFPLCPDCAREYTDPADRRFHAEPLACPVCGPQLQLVRDGVQETTGEQALADVVAALRRAEVVAVKGVGGYHLLCDARSDAAVALLRERKPRPHKPLAVLFPQQGVDGLAAVREYCTLDAEQGALLRSPARPIVLLPLREHGALASAIAPGLAELGVMLPYSPLHHLLLDDFGAPLVATSANLSGEPVLTDGRDVEVRLGRVTRILLHHDRPIVRPADDSVFRPLAGACRPLRLGRGCAPLELTLPRPLRDPVLAVGGHMKNTVALAWHDRVVISPHIGELDSPRGLAVFQQVVEDLQQLYGVHAERLVCDAHPGYASNRWAHDSGLPVQSVFHHHAHASVLAAEYPETSRWLVFAWDGVGYGEDGSLWGGEALLGSPGAWWRVASLRRFHLPGGEAAGRAPWRSALALCWESGIDWPDAPDDGGLLRHAWARGLNAPLSSAAGRLFDAASALTGLVKDASFEGQGPMWLEAQAARGAGQPMALPLEADEHGVWRTDWAPLLPMLLDAARPVQQRAAAFHASLAAAIVSQAERLRELHGDFAVGLVGGVFQNRLLAKQVLGGLQEKGMRAYLPRQVPLNDGGLCLGQVMEAVAGEVY